MLRVGIGGMFIAHGLPKLLAGPEKWLKLGKTMEHLGVDFAPTYFGLAAAVSESLGGLCLALGIATRPALALLVVTMLVAGTQHLLRGDGFGRSSHALESAILFASLMLIGPGKYRLGKGPWT